MEDFVPLRPKQLMEASRQQQKTQFAAPNLNKQHQNHQLNNTLIWAVIEDSSEDKILIC